MLNFLFFLPRTCPRAVCTGSQNPFRYFQVPELQASEMRVRAGFVAVGGEGVRGKTPSLGHLAP